VERDGRDSKQVKQNKLEVQMDMNVKVIGIAITEDELQKATLGEIIQKALEAAQKELGFDLGISTNKDKVYNTKDEEELSVEDRVYNTAVDLIDENDETTTLDIKNAMRACGDWITQKEISDCMDKFFTEGHFDYFIQGNHRVYFVNPEDPDDCNCEDDNENDYRCQTCCCDEDDKVPARVKTDDEAYILIDGEQEDGDWEVYYMGDIIYVDGSVTRSKARVIGSHQFDVDYDEVRACRYHEE